MALFKSSWTLEKLHPSWYASVAKKIISHGAVDMLAGEQEGARKPRLDLPLLCDCDTSHPFSDSERNCRLSDARHAM
jgi:hypothetical protein